MFRRKAQFKPFANLKKSDRKKLVARIAEQYFPGVELSGEAKDQIAAKDVRAAKVVLHSGESAVVYTNDHARPQWIELKDVIAPTVYGAWDAPFVLPLVVTVPYTVDRLQNGAHLMIPGIFEPLPEHAPAGSVVGISLTTSPSVPVAVGITLVDCSRGVLDPDSAEGRAVQIVNIIGDTLWDTYKGDKTVPKDLDRAIPASEGEGAAGDAAGDSSKSTEPSGQPDSQPAGQQEQKDAVDELAASLADAKTQDSPAAGSADSTETPEPESTTDDSLTAEEVDEAFKMALLQVIKKKALGEDIELPISSSQLVSSHILPNLPYKHPGLQMKKTSWKKAAKFFKQAEKDGLVKYRERGGEGVVLSLAAGDHPAIQQFQIYKVKARKPGAAVSSSKKDTDTTKMTAIEYFRPRSAASPLFTAAGLSASGVYPAPVLRDVVNKYIGEHNLVDTRDKKQVVLDDVLAKALGAPATQRTIGRDKLVSSLQANSAPFHIIAPQGRERDFKPAKGPIPAILVATERRGGHKIVTLISGLEKFHIDPVTFFEKLRVACAGSGSVNDLRADSDLKQVMIQGNQVTQVVHLLEQHGVRPAWIETKSKK